MSHQFINLDITQRELGIQKSNLISFLFILSHTGLFSLYHLSYPGIRLENYSVRKVFGR